MNPDWQNAASALAKQLFAESSPSPALTMLAQESAPTAIACSGGPDSLAALLCTWALFPEKRATMLVLHYDHAVRKASADDAAFVLDVCRTLGVECLSERRNEEAQALRAAHSEADLRDLRLDFFARAMRERGCRMLVQGHQRDDIAESLLMRLTRGAGADGLAAPRPVSRQRDGRIFIRPLLEIPKSQILAALRACGIPWCEDATNAGADYFRNRVRNDVLPKLTAAAPFENFARSRKLLEEAADFINAEAEKILGGCYTPEAATALAGQPAALVRAAVQKIFAAQGKIPAAKNIDALVDAIVTKTPCAFSLQNRSVCWNGSTLRIDAPANRSRENEASSWEFESEPVLVSEALFKRICDGAFPPEETVFLAGTPRIFARKARAGERYRPLGAPGEKRLSRIFTDKKIPQALRATLPVFDDGTGIAWIPGLPPAERFRILAAGTPALRLTYRKASLR